MTWFLLHHQIIQKTLFESAHEIMVPHMKKEGTKTLNQDTIKAMF